MTNHRVIRPMVDQLLVFAGIASLTLTRLAYVRLRQVQRDVQLAILPLSKRLSPRDFFRRPRSEDIRFAFWIVQYGVIWYAINLPLMHLAKFDGRRWVYAMILLDIPFIWFSFRLGLIVALIYAGVN